MNGLSFGTRLDQVFIRYRGDSLGFILHLDGVRQGTVERLLLHIDFARAEHDHTTGPHARGTGIIQFSNRAERGVTRSALPYISDRDISRANTPNQIGFVLDFASPYPVPDSDITRGIGRHVVASTLLSFKQSMANAYGQYVEHSRRDDGHIPGVPVFDVYGWETMRAGRDGREVPTYRPRLRLVSWTPDIEEPLPPDEVAELTRRREQAMIREGLARPRIVARV